MPYIAKLISAAFIASCFLVTAVMSNDAHAAKKFYKWVDKDGVTHYSERPPKGKQAEVVNTYTGRGTPPPNQAAKEKEEKPEEETQAAPQPIKNPEVCQSARRNLEILNRNNRVRLKDENGELTILSQEQKEKQRKTAEKAVKDHCG